MSFELKHIGDHSPVVIHNQHVAQVDNTFSWSVHVDYVSARIQQRLHFLRALRVFGVSQKVMLLYYHAIVESIFRYGISRPGLAT